jgi:hypothetical protein
MASNTIASGSQVLEYFRLRQAEAITLLGIDNGVAQGHFIPHHSEFFSDLSPDLFWRFVDAVDEAPDFNTDQGTQPAGQFQAYHRMLAYNSDMYNDPLQMSTRT